MLCLWQKPRHLLNSCLKNSTCSKIIVEILFLLIKCFTVCKGYTFSMQKHEAENSLNVKQAPVDIFQEIKILEIIR